MTKTVMLALIASFTLTATVRAENVNAEEKERAYQILCVPGSEKGLSKKEAGDAKEFRVGFHQFLRNPNAILAQVQRDKAEGGLLAAFGAAIMLAATCGAADVLKDDIATRGCKDDQGRAASTAIALAACAPVMEEFNK